MGRAAAASPRARAAGRIQRGWHRYAARREYLARRQARLAALEERLSVVQRQEQREYLHLLEADEEEGAEDRLRSVGSGDPVPQLPLQLLLADEAVQRGTIVRVEGHHRSRLARLMACDFQAFAEEAPVFQTNKERRRRQQQEEEERRRLAMENHRWDLAILEDEMRSVEQAEQRERAQ
eukprot:EG_transcript_34241